MEGSPSSFESELRISPKPVIATLVLLGIAVFLLSIVPPGVLERLAIMLFATLFQALAGVAWLLNRWKPCAGRWFTILAFVTVIHLASIWLGMPGSLALAAIPAALAAALISLPAAAVTAVGETTLVWLLPRFAGTGVSPATTATATIAIWAILGVMYVVYRPVHQVAQWSWKYFQQAHTLLEETRDRKAELEQTLNDLADANLQLTRLNILAQGLRQAAEGARTAKEQFVANVSHELRTPLNMITGFSEMILQAPETYGSKIPPALLADLAVIHRNAAHLAELIDDVLDLSQIEAERMALTKEHVQFHEIVETATTAVRPLFDSKGLYLRTDIPEGLPLVFCDRTRIREVLLNLLSNAGRFTEHGGVHVRVWQEGEDILVAVADTGRGITAKDMSKLFQPFQQLDGSIRRRYGGTGLGLSISKRFIELHGGKIWVESEEGVGTTFIFRLPLAPPRPISGGPGARLSPGWEYMQRTRPSMAPEVVVRPRFIVLDAGGSLQRLLARYLNGVEIKPVKDLEEALAELSRVPAQALLVNGPSVSRTLELLMSTTLPSGTPAVVCSIPSVHEASAALGVSDHLVKPVSRERLLGALDRLELERGTILIVDDEPDALHLFGRMLASSGREYRILLARDGREAMEILREPGKHRPDVILLDLVMPTMDGFQLLETRSEDPVLRDIPIIVISARDPMGQPIVSSALAVTRGGGLSAHQILTSIELISRALSASAPVGGPTPLETLLDSPACG
ncbi:MAG TPA: ATP-binding protein [Anaerolineae bacterium]|nr:ATP-binding protein [Anaerolineae bacterium]